MSIDTTPAFRTDLIGRWSERSTFAVTREAIAAYAAATNDGDLSGDVAPPVFAVVPAWGAVKHLSAIVPPELVLRILHGEQDMRFHRPIEAGMELISKGAAIGVHSRSSGVTITNLVETRTPDGALVVEQYLTTFVRGAQVGESVGQPTLPHPFPAHLREVEPTAEVDQTFDDDQTYRYAAASGDDMRVHLDEQAARDAGLPGVIIHGLCTLAFTARALIETVCPQDPSRLKRLAVRFSAIALPGQTITTRIWEDRAACAFETTSDAGAVVIKDGLAEFAAR